MDDPEVKRQRRLKIEDEKRQEQLRRSKGRQEKEMSEEEALNHSLLKILRNLDVLQVSVRKAPVCVSQFEVVSKVAPPGMPKPLAPAFPYAISAGIKKRTISNMHQRYCFVKAFDDTTSTPSSKIFSHYFDYKYAYDHL